MDNLGNLKKLDNHLTEVASQKLLGIFLNPEANTIIVIFSNLNKHTKALKSECSKTNYYKQHPELVES